MKINHFAALLFYVLLNQRNFIIVSKGSSPFSFEFLGTTKKTTYDERIFLTCLFYSVSSRCKVGSLNF